MRKSPPRASIPLRKQFMKKVITYYDELKAKTTAEQAEKPLHRSDRSKSPWRKEFMDEPTKQLSYHDDIHTKLKLVKVKELMKEEYQKSMVDGVLDYEDPEFNKTHYMQKGSPSRDHSREASVEHKQMDELVKEKMIAAENITPLSDEEIEEEELGGTKDGLFHLDIEHIETYKNSRDKEKFDHHQRKSKEIRRIQYWAELGNRKKKERKSTPTKNEDENYDEEPRSDPKRKYPIWVVVNAVSVPAFISSPYGFALSPDGNNIEIREGDKVLIEPKTKGGFKVINGLVQKPSRQDGDCDFAAIDSGLGRFPIQITERKKKRDVPNTNCTLYDTEGEKIGRAHVKLIDSESPHHEAQYSKGVLLDGDGELSLILVHLLRAGFISYKTEDGALTKDRISREDIVIVGNHKTTCLTLEPKPGYDDPQFPRQIFLFGKKNKVENHPIFEREPSIAICEDGKDYDGNFKVQEDDEPNRPLLWIKKDKKIPASNDNTGNPGLSHLVNVDLDEKCSYPEIDSLLDKLQDVADKRKDKVFRANEKKREGLDFRIIDKQGRKLRVKITDDNEDNFEPEPIDPADTENPQSIFYQLEYDGKHLSPVNVMVKGGSPTQSSKKKQTASPKKNSAQKRSREASPDYDYGIDSPQRPAQYRNIGSAPTKKDQLLGSASTFKTGKAHPTTAHNTHSSGRNELGTGLDSHEKSQKRSSSNLRVKMDVADGKTRTVDIIAQGEAYFNQRVVPLGSFEGLGFKPEKLSDQVKRIRNKAAEDIQIFLRYCLNKRKFRRNYSIYLPRIRKELAKPRLYSKFVAYFMDLPADISIEDAFNSYLEVLGHRRH